MKEGFGAVEFNCPIFMLSCSRKKRLNMKKIAIVLFVLLALVPSVCFAAPTKTFAGIEVENYLGDKVTADIFKDYDVTMVNLFTTWCGYCIREMPDIEKLSKNLPAKSNLIAICADAYEAPEDLKDIVDAFGLDFTILKMTEDELDGIYSTLGYPTTLFVDKSGKVIDELVGMRSYSEYRNEIVSLLNRK